MQTAVATPALFSKLHAQPLQPPAAAVSGLLFIGPALTVPYVFPSAAVIYIELFSVQHSDSIDRNLVFYSVAILNASSALVRVLGSYLADLYGPFNVQVACSIGGGTLIWAMLGILVSSLPLSSRLLHCSPHNGGSLVISLLYGAFSNAYTSPCLASLAKGPEEIGARTGVALALSSLGVLVSAPIQGALLTSDYHWIRPVAFAATMTFVSGACYFVTRTLHARVTSTWRV
ncbi:hypothetical protein DFH08DRAFT_951365 [Mycena albidolilacea]|uniref:Uncharacterized protein n=1 Tax=Mycena albidolilacea TaxID=1033008 RepID=A0AAD7AJB1_9AGAR|nr:hypothetical protein DFH08DRAFT_951365 [Mycena albidolilacea]